MPLPSRKRQLVKRSPGNKNKKVRLQRGYHSSSSDSELDTAYRPKSIAKPQRSKDTHDASAESLSVAQLSDLSSSLSQDELDDEFDVGASSSGGEEEGDKKSRDFGDFKQKRNDPAVFATSISRILGAKLSTARRADPVLSRSKEASQAAKEMELAKLESKARQKLKTEKKAGLEKGRIKDVLGLQNTEILTSAIMERERQYKKTAQRGVIKLFNALRAAQVTGEQAARNAANEHQGAQVNEMSKKSFLDLIASSGK